MFLILNENCLCTAKLCPVLSVVYAVIVFCTRTKTLSRCLQVPPRYVFISSHVIVRRPSNVHKCLFQIRLETDI